MLKEISDAASNNGSIIFGGVDSNQHDGPLHVLPLATQNDPEANYLFSYVVNLKSITLGASSDPKPLDVDVSSGPYASFDSGSSFTQCPESIYQPLKDRYHVNDSQQIDCSYKNSSEQITFQLGANATSTFNFSLPVSNFVQGNSTCFFYIEGMEKGLSYVVFGDNILRYLYTVFDPENNRVAVAPVRTNVTTSNITQIVPGMPISGSV